jgi:glycosyltransferase involved in cell wall biosynthesis
MSRPLISVIVPTYNRPLELSEVLESLLRQNYPNLQVIVINDCGQPVEPIKALYPELDITIINMESNLKHVHARNRGLQEARGEYILLCDDDDLLLPGHVERMLAAIEDNDLVYSDVEIFDYQIENGVRIATSRRIFAYEYSLEGMRQFSTFVSSGCLYRRAIHDQLGPFDTEIYNYWDWDFFLRVAGSYQVKRVPVASALYAFSQGGGNISGRLDNRTHYLNKLSAKHSLGELPTTNFFLLLEEPEMKRREASTEIVWDGEPIRSRFREGQSEHSA